jgi:hypothetical protein
MSVFVKKKEDNGGFRLKHTVANATNTEEIIKEIKDRLSWIETPTFLDNFEESIVKSLTGYIWGRRTPCKSASFAWDEYPSIKFKYLDADTTYRREYHVDTITCDNKKYELEAEYEFYETPYGFIVHSFKPIDVREASE